MKLLLIALSLLSFSAAQAFEGPGCVGSYASGIGHVMKGESISFTDSELIKVGSTVSDEFYTARVYQKDGKAKVALINNRTGKKVKLTTGSFGEGLSIQSTANLIASKDRPEYVPGQISGNAFLIFLCID